jgi:hypothetical protein
VVGVMTANEARHILNLFISAERGMRSYVFRNDTAKREKKLRECDEALAALNVLAPEVVEVEQQELWAAEDDLLAGNTP